MKNCSEALKNNKGSSAVIMTLSLTLLLIMAAFVVDLASCYIETADLQNAVDAAVLAAGMKLPAATDDNAKISEVQDTINLYLSKNKKTQLDSIEIAPQNAVNGKYTGVRVRVGVHVNTAFARIIGINQISVGRSAAAQISPITEISGLVPLSIDETYLNQAIAAGQTQHLTLKFGATTGVQGSFGALDLDGSKSGGANDYECNLLTGYSGSITVGSILPVEPGNMSGPTFDSFWSRYDSCTHYSGQGGCTVDHFETDCPRVVMVPVIRYISSKEVEIAGFAAFILEAGTGNGTQSTVTGSFINVVTKGSSYDSSGPGGTDDYGVYTVHLS